MDEIHGDEWIKSSLVVLFPRFPHSLYYLVDLLISNYQWWCKPNNIIVGSLSDEAILEHSQ